MERTVFSRILNLVTVATDDDDIWWSGYVFVDMTPAQRKRVVKILIGRPDIAQVVVKNNRVGVQLPSGIILFEN